MRPKLRRDIHELMEQWVRWSASRDDGNSGLGWPHTTVTGRLLRDMPTTRCSTCDGRGQIPGSRVGSALKFIECPVCAGKGKINADPRLSSSETKPCRHCVSENTGKPLGETKGTTCVHCRGSGRVTNHEHKAVNPAYIRATGFGSRTPQDDSLMARIDWLVVTLPEDERVVVMHEYRWSRTRQQALKRLRVSNDYFSDTLADALARIYANLS